MNSTIRVIRSSEPLCPLDERRTKTELLVKLFVVHFTTVGAFFHLLNLRGEYLLSLRPIFYICAPLSFIAQHVIAAATLILRIPLVCIRHRRYPDIETDLIRPVKSLLANFEDTSIKPGLQSQSELESGQSRERRNGFGERAIRRFGRVLVTMAFLTQCSLSLLLYHRRKMQGPDSIALIDKKIFQFAASGVLVSLLTLGVTLRFPCFRLPNPEPISSSNKIERIMICLGHRRAPSVTSQSQDTIMSPIACFFALSVTSCLALYASGRIQLTQEFRCLDKCESLPTPPRLLSGGVVIVVITIILAFVWSLAFVTCLVLFGHLSDVCEPVFCLIPFFFVASMVLSSFSGYLFLRCIPEVVWKSGLDSLTLVFFYPFYLITGSIQTPYVAIKDYLSIFAQLNEWKDWPEDVACPFLWKDSMADQVWWLA